MANPSADFPTSVHTETDVSGYANTALGKTAVKHTEVEGKQEAEIGAIQTKIGTGASTPGTGKILYSTGAGVSAWTDLNTLADTRYLQISNNLSDIANAATARTNLGLVAGGAGDIWVEKAGDTITGKLHLNRELLVHNGKYIEFYADETEDDYRGGITFGTAGQFALDYESTAILDVNSITAVETFTFPDTSGTFALLEAENVFTVDQTITPTANSTTTLQVNQADGTNVLTVDTINGRVGIGTTGPSSTLEIGSGQILVPDGSASAPSYAFSSGTNTGFYFASTQINMSTGGTRRVAVDSNGLFGSTGGSFIALNEAATSTNPSLAPNRTDLDTGIGWVSADILSLIAGGTNVMNITNGNVGIGTTGPLAKLHIDQSVADAAIPVLSLDQTDISDGFINFIGATAASAAGPISSWTAGNSIQGFVRVEINGVQYWMPYYDAPTS